MPGVAAGALPLPSGTARWVAAAFPTDHKVVARWFLASGFAFLTLGGFLAVLMRWQMAFPGAPVPVVGRALFPESSGAISPADYPKLFTSHGLIMIFFGVTPLLIGALGNFLIPLLIGAQRMAFPRLSTASIWLFLLAQGLMLASFLAPLGTAGSGWTSYPPLSERVGQPGAGQSWVALALLAAGASSFVGAINFVATVIGKRAPGMTWIRLPATVWGLWLSALLNVAFIPVIAVAMVVLLVDRHLGTGLFLAGASLPAGGDPLAYQHLFWIFGHPEVYILILPAWGIVTDLVSHFARQEAHAYRGTVGALIAIAAMSGLVYGHHLYVAGVSPMLGRAFMVLTLGISLPSIGLALNWLQTLWRGRARLDAPMLYALGVILLFGLGGLTGLLLGDVALDRYLHDSLFVVGHFHLTMAAATLLACFAGIQFWFPKMFGRQLSEGLGKAHCLISVLGFIAVFGGLLWAGWSGQPRRLYDPFQYTFLEKLRGLNRITTYCAFALVAGQGLFAWNVLATLFGRGPASPPNPWSVGTLEWTSTSTPVAAHNFDRVPTVVRGPHAYVDDRFQPQAEG